MNLNVVMLVRNFRQATQATHCTHICPSTCLYPVTSSYIYEFTGLFKEVKLAHRATGCIYTAGLDSQFCLMPTSIHSFNELLTSFISWTLSKSVFSKAFLEISKGFSIF